MAVEGGGIINRSITAGVVADATVLQNTGRVYLFVQNLHASAIVYFRVDQTTKAGGTATVAVAGAAGTIRLGPGDAISYEGEFVPGGALSIISDTATTPVTVLEA